MESDTHKEDHLKRKGSLESFYRGGKSQAQEQIALKGGVKSNVKKLR